MATNIHDDFENEHDLANEFESEQDVKHASLPARIAHNMATTAQSVLPDSSGALDTGSDLLNTAIDTARGVGQGLLMGATDEIGGALGAAGEYLYNKFNPTDRELEAKGFDIQHPNLPDLYRKNQQDIQKELETSSERSPWLYTGGQIAGGMTSGSAIGGVLGVGKAAPGARSLLDIARNDGKLKALAELGIRGAKSYKQALPVIMAESALSSKEGGLLTPEERSKLTEDVAGGALFGLPAAFGMQAVSDVAVPLAAERAAALKGKIQDVVGETPLLRQMKIAYGYGKQGINPKSQSATLATDLGNTGLSELDNQRTTKLMDEIYEAQKRVGAGVNSALENATNNGKLVDITTDIQDALSQIQTLATKYPEITENPRAAQIFEKIAQGQTQITPVEANDLIKYIDSYIGKFKSSTNKTPGEEGILSNLLQNRKQFSNTLKTTVPEYGEAAERYNQFMKLVPETIIAGNRPVDIKGEFFSDMNNQDQKLFDQLKRLNQGTTREGTATQPIRESFVNTVKGLKTFEQQEADRLAAGKISNPALSRSATDIENEIKMNSDDAVARGAMDALQPHTGVATTLAKTLTGTGETGRAMSLSASNIAGRVTRKIGQSSQGNPISKITRGIYTAPDETVLALSQKLKSVPALQKYGQSLEDALNSTDSNRRNQILFTIMQNPNARAFVKDEHEDMTETPENTSGSYTPQQ